MRIHEFVVETVNEVAPAGYWTQQARKIGGKFSPQIASNLRTGDRANKLYKAFEKFALDTGKPLDKILPNQIKDWFKKYNLPFPESYNTVPNFKFTDKEFSNKFWTAAAYAAYEAGRGGQAVPGLARSFGIKPATETPPPPPAGNPKLDTEIQAMRDLINRIRDNKAKRALQARLTELIKAAKTPPTA